MLCFNPLPSQKQGETALAARPCRCLVSFNPLPSQKQGETRCICWWPTWTTCFNPLPSQKQGETRRHRRPRRAADGFNPLPSQKQGETRAAGTSCSRPKVSIRSPHKSKGRRRSLCPPCRAEQFQSAPLTKARGDPAVSTARSPKKCFNPLPSQKQGETQRSYSRVACYASFNPLPSQKQGETRAACPHQVGTASFNPLPSQKQGETRRHNDEARIVVVSIRSPHKSKGRLVETHRGEFTRKVSIRSPHKSKGRHHSESGRSSGGRFQSAPLTKARGD